MDLLKEISVYSNPLDEELLKKLIEIAPNPIFVADDDGTMIYLNQSASSFLGVLPKELIGRKIPALFQTKTVAASPEEGGARPLNDQQAIRSCEFSRKDGDRAWGEVRTARLGENVQVAFVTDLTLLRHAEQSLLESEERYRNFTEQSSEGIWRFEVDPPIHVKLPTGEQIELFFKNSYLAECNDVMARQYGYKKARELIGKKLEDLLDYDNTAHREYLRAFIEKNYQIKDQETIEKDKSGNEKHFLNNLIGFIKNENLYRVWGTQIDATAIRLVEKTILEAEEKQRQTGKVEAIGRLAGGIAHDFNNFLAVIMLHVDMLNLQLPAESPLRFRIEEIKSVTNNAAGMVRQLLAFGRKQTLQPNPVVLNQVVKEFIKVLQPLIGEDNEINLNLDPDLGICFVDQNQVSQVLMNLAVNAKDAMPGGGIITIETSNLKIKNETAHHKAQPAGSYIQLSVRDTGVGMTREIRQRVFEPFFTTKESSKGTGLGLATVYGIVKQSNGFIWVKSEVNQGTTFHIQFPRIDKPAEEIKVQKTGAIPDGDETILLVEDEDQIRNAAVEVLNLLGYEVFEASGGKQAIQLAELYRKKIDLLVTDVIMPRMNGREVAELVKATHPETKVLFISGYTDDIISKHGVLEKDIHFLNKPFTPSVLATKIREVLDH